MLALRFRNIITRARRTLPFASQKVILTILPSLLILYSITTPSALAADSTPSADIKSKLEELKKEIASKAALLKQQVNQRLQNKAYVGSIKTKTSTSLTLASVSGPKMVTINQDTVYESRVKSRKKFSQKDLKEEDEVAALGEVDEIGVLTAKKIVLLPTTNSQPKTYLWGQIVSISDKLATLKNRENKNVAVSLPSSASVKANEFVILTGSFGKKEIFNAEFIFTTQGGVLKNNKTSTPSATPKKK